MPQLPICRALGVQAPPVPPSRGPVPPSRARRAPREVSLLARPLPAVRDRPARPQTRPAPRPQAGAVVRGGPAPGVHAGGLDTNTDWDYYIGFQRRYSTYYMLQICQSLSNK